MRTAHWTILTAALIFCASCGKKEKSAPTPVLSAPGTVEKVQAEAEVKASSGPVELTFLLHKTRIKAGDYLWQQIRIRNIGNKVFAVADQVFHDPWELQKHSGSGYGIYIEALDPYGKRLKVEYSLGRYKEVEEVSGLLEVEGPQEQAMLDGWEKQGLSKVAIDRKLLEFKMNKRAARNWKTNPVIRLSPGQSAETKSAFFYSMRDERNGKQVPKPIGDFAQIDFFHFDKPGQYKLRAVYSYAPTKESMKIDRQFHHGPDPSEVLVRTPWIAIEVRP